MVYYGFSALQRAEIAEICERASSGAINSAPRFSALQRAEIAEIFSVFRSWRKKYVVSVLFNEPKLLKS